MSGMKVKELMDSLKKGMVTAFASIIQRNGSLDS